VSRDQRCAARQRQAQRGIGRRTAERMRDAVESVFGPLDWIDDGRKKRFRIVARGLGSFATAPTSEELLELEEELDVFFDEGVIQFDIKKWSIEKGVKPQIAKRITEHFRPQYEEISEAQEGKDADLVEAYKGWRKPVLKIMGLFLKKIIDHMTEVDAAGQAIRKPRAKKVKPASVLVSKLQFLPEFKELNITSVDPKGIINASQLWVFNPKTRNLSVYHAVGRSGLSIRGTTITGYDTDVSLTKKVRKPEQVIPQVMNAGKVDLRSIMKNLSTTESKANGRINKDTILLRVIK
jgi:hypothetical protein